MSKQTKITFSIVLLSVVFVSQIHAQQAKKPTSHQLKLQNKSNRKGSVITSTILMSDSKDPVCRMSVSKGDTVTAVYNDIQFGFCSEYCRKMFVAAPNKYIKR